MVRGPFFGTKLGEVWSNFHWKRIAINTTPREFDGIAVPTTGGNHSVPAGAVADSGQELDNHASEWRLDA